VPTEVRPSSRARRFLSSRLLWSESLGSAAREAHRLGYQGLEIWSEHAWRDGPISKLRRELERVPLQYALHGPFMDLNLCSRNPRIAKLSLEECVRALSLARAVGASVMVVHPGRLSSGKDDPEEYWPDLIEALAKLGRHAANYELVLAVENMEPRPRELVTTPKDAQRLLGSVGSKSVQMCLDLAHARLKGANTVSAFIRLCGPMICHIHVSNVTEGRAHLPLNRGKSPVTPRVLRFLRREFSGVVTVEGATPPGARTAEIGLAALAELLDGTRG